ncbi:hypothetical protein AO385_1674 [Moraxella catarrhalis]|uniref:Uncharacterized protein n=1 Tax=Moraxella catarrhalis TaxID=480 RepID=A0A198UGZ4_MORCA|nr:hypothetical protein AO384_1221 [Moraxella catarrhalis]OAU97366.1 hypothetical protein AO383_0926 [Moraxella catarrhalis]OAU97916.1 hypothetical protein AO385_1674 [Moraxella catarrhalis]
MGATDEFTSLLYEIRQFLFLPITQTDKIATQLLYPLK